MARHQHDDDPPAHRDGNWPDIRRIDRDTPRGMWLFLFCAIIIVAGMFFGTLIYLSSRGADVQPLINAVTDVNGVVPTLLSTLGLIVLAIVKRQNNRVEALAGREGPSALRAEVAQVREALARVEAAPVLTSGPIPVTVAPTPEPDVYGVTVDPDPDPAAAAAAEARSPYAVPDDGGIIADPRSWTTRTTTGTGSIPRVREYHVTADDQVVADPPPTRPGRREAVPAWSDVPYLQEPPVPTTDQPAPSRWAKPGG